ncbi:hypothetical protein NKH77_02280 [Streptomyces sp. M19]
MGDARVSLDLGSPLFEQLLLTELLARPGIVAARVAELRERRDALADAVRAECPDWAFRVPDGGMSLWCGLPAPVCQRLVSAAEGKGVLLVPGARFGVQDRLERWLRLPFTQPPGDCGRRCG